MKFEDFFLISQSLGKKLKRSRNPDELAYLNSISELIPKIKSIPNVKMENICSEWSWTLLNYRAPVGAVRMKLQKGGKLPVHDHRGYISLLYVINGEVKISHYSCESEPTSSTDFVLNQTSEEYFSKGGLSFATSDSNIHSVEDTGCGSDLLDISTFLSGRGESYVINLEPVSIKKSNSVFHGTWSGVKL